MILTIRLLTVKLFPIKLEELILKKTYKFLMWGSLALQTISAVAKTDNTLSYYTEINVRQSLDMIRIFNQDSAYFDDSKNFYAESIYKSPGDFTPPVLLEAGIYFLLQKDFEKAAPLCVGALSRCDIDILISHDKTVVSTTSILKMHLDDVIEVCNFDNTQEMNWQDNFERAKKNFENWDRNTPRHYDDRWIHLNSLKRYNCATFSEISDQEKYNIIQRYYRYIKDDNSSETYENLSPDGEFSFDPKSRIFTHKKSGLSFYLPETIKPKVDFFGKELSRSFYFGKRRIFLTEIWNVKEPYNLQSEYELACREAGPDEIVEKITIGKNALPAFSTRLEDEDEVTTAITFVHSNYYFSIDVTYEKSEEDQLLSNLQVLLDSLKF